MSQAQGSPAAPPLGVAAWIGKPPQEIEDQLLVVEVWATWCHACHATFPLLSRVQQAYNQRVFVVALTDERPDRVRRFVDAHRRQMRFSVAVSDEETVRRWMFGGFGGRGLPSVYLVQAGRVVWGGEPAGLEDALRERLGPMEGDDEVGEGAPRRR